MLLQIALIGIGLSRASTIGVSEFIREDPPTESQVLRRLKSDRELWGHASMPELAECPKPQDATWPFMEPGMWRNSSAYEPRTDHNQEQKAAYHHDIDPGWPPVLRKRGSIVPQLFAAKRTDIV